MVGRQTTTGARIRLREPLASDFADFCAVVYEIDDIKVIRKAVREHMDRMLAENEGLRREYEARRKQRLAAERGGKGHLHPVDD